MKEKLELHQIAPYLPYGLKYYLPLDNYRVSDFVDHETWKFTHDIFTAIENGYESALEYKNMTISQNNPFLCIEDNELFLGQMKSSLGFDVDDVFLNEVKPILRPLSDLTKEIEHNGEKFIAFYHKEFEIELRTEVKTGFFDSMYIEEKLSIISESNKVNTVFEKSISILNKLFEWHFDVFGLIEKDLAIDINALDV